MDDREKRIELVVPALRRFAWSLTRDADRGDDLVQDCLERALGAWHRRRDETALRAWLFAILYNLHCSGRRRSASRSRLLGEVFHLRDEATPAGAQEAAVYCAQILTQLHALPEEQRAVLLLVGVEGFGYEEAARALGVPVGTVMSRLSRGRDRLRSLGEARGAPVVPLRRVS